MRELTLDELTMVAGGYDSVDSTLTQDPDGTYVFTLGQRDALHNAMLDRTGGIDFTGGQGPAETAEHLVFAFLDLLQYAVQGSADLLAQVIDHLPEDPCKAINFYSQQTGIPAGNCSGS